MLFRSDLELAQQIRKEGASMRLGKIPDSMSGNMNGTALLGAWNQQKLASSAPLYEKFNGSTIQTDPELSKMLSSVEGMGLTKRANFLSLAEDKAPLNFDPTSAIQSPKALNYIKQSIDAEIYKAIANEDGNTVAALTKFKNEFIAKVDKLSGGTYKPALNNYSGYASMESALQSGRSAWNAKMTTDQIGQILSTMSPSEQQAFRIGAADALSNKFGMPAGRTEFTKDRKSHV